MSGRDDKRLAVPKFSSFKPKAPDKAAATASETPAPGDDGKRSRRGSKRRRHHSSITHGDDKRGSRSRSRSRSPRAGKRPRSSDPGRRPGTEDVNQRQPATEVASLPMFVVDKKGDPLLRKFGVDKYKMPQFRRQGRESVLGTDGYLYIHRDGANEEFSIRRRGEFHGSSTREKNPFRTRIRYQAQARPLRASKDAGAGGPGTGDFISLSTHRKRSRRDEVPSDDEGLPDYKSIQRAKPRGAADSDLDEESAESSGDDVTAERDPLNEKSIELSRRVKEHPGDIPAWLELIDHQDVLMKAGADINEDLPVDEVKSFAEIKLSMYEKALRHAQSPRDRERLLVGQMRDGAKVWDEEAIAARWAKLTKEIDDNFSLWRANLDFEMANIETFQYARVKGILIRRLALLNARAVQQLVPPGDLGTLYSEMIYVFLRATRFFHDCGYTELSVAAWQALLELNFSSGNDFSAPQPSVPDSFTEFWESEVPRMGEEGAMGWDHFVRTGGPDVPEPVVAKNVPFESRDVYKAWAAEELRRSRKARMPSRTLDEDDYDDPFGVIMYSDLEGLPFIIPRDVLREVRGDLVDAFLTFCQIPTSSRGRPWETDPLVAPRDKALHRAILDMYPSAYPTTQPSPEEDSSRPPPAQFATGRVTPAIAPGFICSLIRWGRYNADPEDSPVCLDWVVLTLKTLVIRGHTELARYYLALEWIRDRKKIRSPARDLIRAYPEDIGLYNLYAGFEWENGNVEMAKTVLSSATRLKLASSAAAALPLWLTWAWLEFVDGAPFSRVMERLCFLTDEERTPEGPSPAVVWKQKQELASTSQQLLLGGALEGLSINARVLALLEYLSSTTSSEPRSERQGSISSAMEVVWRHSEALVAAGQGKCVQHEELLGFAATLLYIHTTRGPYRKTFLSTELKKCVLLFPTNTNFLSLFDWAASNLRINDEFRNLLSEHVLTRDQDTVGLRTFAILREMASGSIYTAAAAFDRALDSVAGRNPWFWTCYVRFCRARDDEDDRAKGAWKKKKAVDNGRRDLAKKAYYKGLARCPWAKGLAMEGFTTLLSVLQSRELKGGYGSIEGKGLRLNLDLGEFAEKRRAR